MLYTTMTIGEKEYKLRLTAKASVEAEKKLGINPLTIFTRFNDSEELPKLEDMIIILHASMTAYNHGITLNDVYDLYDEFIDEGNTMIDLIPIIIEVFRVSGFFKEVEEPEKN